MEFINLSSLLPEETWNIVMFILVLVGILVAIVGYSLYRVAEHHIEKRSDKITRGAEERATEVVNQGLRDLRETAGSHIARLYAYHNFAFADIVRAFEPINKDAAKALQRTKIDYAREAKSHTDHLDKEREDELICVIYNNLAWDLADRGDIKDRHEAHNLVTYIAERASRYPESEVNFRETQAYVLWKLPLRTEDKLQAQRIIRDLLRRTDISDETKNKWKLRYKLKARARQ